MIKDSKEPKIGVVVLPDPFGEAALRAVLNDNSIPEDLNLIEREVKKRMDAIDVELPRKYNGFPGEETL